MTYSVSLPLFLLIMFFLVVRQPVGSQTSTKIKLNIYSIFRHKPRQLISMVIFHAELSLYLPYSGLIIVVRACALQARIGMYFMRTGREGFKM
jgi:hypothetical protein